MSRVKLYTIALLICSSFIAGFFFYSYFFIFNTSEQATIVDMSLSREVVGYYQWEEASSSGEILQVQSVAESYARSGSGSLTPSNGSCPRAALDGSCRPIARIRRPSLLVEVRGEFGTLYTEEFPLDWVGRLSEGQKCNIHTNTFILTTGTHLSCQ